MEPKHNSCMLVFNNELLSDLHALVKTKILPLLGKYLDQEMGGSFLGFWTVVITK